MRIYGIYKIVNKTNGKYYVGSSNDIYKRWKSHKKHLKHNYHENNHLQKSWNKYGESEFEFSVIKSFPENTPRNDLLKEEQSWLDIAYKEKKKTYNLTFIAGGGTLGGKDSPNFGHKHTIESREKMSKSKLGFKHSDVTKQKMSISKSINYSGKNHPMYGKHLTDETKYKLSKSYEFINPQGIMIQIRNLTEFCKNNRLDTSSMCKVFNGRLLHYKKWKSVPKIKENSI